jgi:hypothetical protein
MVAAIPNDKRTRLVRLLGVLGSDFGGERANAGRLADTLVRSLGLRWHDVIAATEAREQQHAAPPGARQNRARDHREAAAACLASGCIWTEWERGFLTSLQRRWMLTEKQKAVLQHLCFGPGSRTTSDAVLPRLSRSDAHPVVCPELAERCL